MRLLATTICAAALLLADGGAALYAQQPPHAQQSRSVQQRSQQQQQRSQQQQPRRPTAMESLGGGLRRLGRRIFGDSSESQMQPEQPSPQPRAQGGQPRHGSPPLGQRLPQQQQQQRRGDPRMQAQGGPAPSPPPVARRPAPRAAQPAQPAEEPLPGSPEVEPAVEVAQDSVPSPVVPPSASAQGSSRRRRPGPAVEPSVSPDAPADEIPFRDEELPDAPPPEVLVEDGPAASATQPEVQPLRHPTDDLLPEDVEAAPLAAPTERESSRRLPRAGESSSQEVLVAQRSSVLNVETSGPRRVTVGKPGAYVVALTNPSDLPAEEIVVTIALPAWAEFTEGAASAGQAASEADGSYVWRLEQLPGRGTAQLDLLVTPRENRPFELSVQCVCAPSAVRTTVEVAEPLLALEIDGPTAVEFGQPQTYALHVRNPGTADAENVVVHLVPLKAGGERPALSLGTLRAGTEKTLEIELTPRDVGTLAIAAEATADGGLQAQAQYDVLVQRAELQIEVAAPQRLFAGRAARVQIHVTNRGNLPARDVAVTAALPRGATIRSAGDDAEPGEAGQVQWRIAELAPGRTQTLQLEADFTQPLLNEIQVTADLDGALAGEAVARVEVTAVADLALEVDDPAGPYPVGSDAVYVVRVRNRGAAPAEHVQIVAFFSEGIEPVECSLAGAEFGNGRAALPELPVLQPGEEITLQITARAAAAGQHRCRVELVCEQFGEMLAVDESTLYYDEALHEPAPEAATTPEVAERPGLNEPAALQRR